MTQTQTLKARAWKSGMPPGNTASATYTMQVATPSVSPSAGTYTSARTVTLATSRAGATIRYTVDGTDPTPASPAYASALTIATTTTLKAVGFKANWSDSVVRTATYTMNFGTLTAPTITPGAGTFTGQVMVTLEAQPFAAIHYTVNGGTPTTGSPLYGGPFPVDVSATVRAKAFHPDYTASAVSTQAYSVVASTPVLSLPSGSYAPGTALTVTSPDPGATLRWTLDGTDPTASSPAIPATPILIGEYTIKVRAFRTGAGDSAVATGTYSLTAPLSGGAGSAGDRHTLLATPEGMVYAWGFNTNVQLGDGTSTTRPTPVLVPTLTGVVAVAAGGLHSLAATADGQLWAWGYNAYGRLGDGTSSNRSRPVPIGGLPPIVAVAAGASHSLVLASTGQVYAFGYGASGQLGQGTTGSSSVPLLVNGLANVVAIAAGANHNLAVTAEGQVWAWGANTSSQLGDGTTTSRLTPVAIGGLSDVVHVAAGAFHSLARTRSGALWAWGDGGGGKLGLGSQTDHPVPVMVPGTSAAVLAAGTNHSGALSPTGVLLGWGTNTSGQVGNGTTSSVLTPTELSGPTGVTLLAQGSAHSVAVAMDGGVWTWGDGYYSQLGDGTTADRLAPALAWTAPGRWSPPPPTLSLAAGTYATEQIVLITSAVPGATLRYTTTGVDPTASDPEVPATGDVLITGTTTLKARAWVPDRAPSVVASATYMLQPAAPTVAPGTGTYVGPQTVTLSAADPQAVLRYTVGRGLLFATGRWHDLEPTGAGAGVDGAGALEPAAAHAEPRVRHVRH
ncbi:MAG: chitobiase/beta-hexosaminidase C-terminal domain-containing protein [Acidobacteria bacterium]|nr:chitobiase/beta-hexosaminidase C-terminal domain-containing protein [Acidobacteriota bacterium]